MQAYGTRLAFALFITPLLSGCLDGESSIANTPRFEAFDATIDFNGTSFELTFQGPLAAKDRDASTREAYRLDLRDDAAELLLTYWIDGAGHLVRTDRPCADAMNNCDMYVFVSYFEQGGVPPFGVGLPIAIDRGTFVDWSTRRPNSLNLDVDRRDHFVIRFSDDGKGNHPGSEGPLVYVDGRSLPEGPSWSVTHYEAGAALSSAPVWPYSQVPSTNEQRRPPGWSSLAPGTDASFAQMEEALREADVAAAKMLDEGCILRIEVTPGQPGISGNPWVADWTLGQENERAGWRVTEDRTPILGMMQTSAGTPASGPSCVDIASSGMGTLDPSTVPEQLAEWVPRNQGQQAFIYHAWRPPNDRLPEHGMTSYTIHYVPAYVSGESLTAYRTYDVQIDALTGLIESLVTHPDDV